MATDEQVSDPLREQIRHQLTAAPIVERIAQLTTAGNAVDVHVRPHRPRGRPPRIPDRLVFAAQVTARYEGLLRVFRDFTIQWPAGRSRREIVALVEEAVRGILLWEGGVNPKAMPTPERLQRMVDASLLRRSLSKDQLCYRLTAWFEDLKVEQQVEHVRYLIQLWRKTERTLVL